MKLIEKLEEYETARELFPRCYKCGRDLSHDRLTSLRIATERANRFACKECPPHAA